MSDPFIGEIRMFAGTFAPRDWALCDNQLIAISQNEALFSLLGVIYGGDGRTTFALPGMRGRQPVHMGAGPGLTSRTIGQRIGVVTVALNKVEYLPSHNHPVLASNNNSDKVDPAGNTLGVDSDGQAYFQETDQSQIKPLIDTSIGNSGSSQPHANMGPYLTITFIIALKGTYPSRN